MRGRILGIWAVTLICLALAGCDSGGYDGTLAEAYTHGVEARATMAKAGFGGSEVTEQRCGDHFDATEPSDEGNPKFRALAREYFIRGCRTPPTTTTTTN